jgi:hypothetical protein
MSRSRPPVVPAEIGLESTGDPERDLAAAAELLDAAVARRVALCLRPDMDGADLLYRAERVVLDAAVRDLRRYVEGYEGQD